MATATELRPRRGAGWARGPLVHCVVKARFPPSSTATRKTPCRSRSRYNEAMKRIYAGGFLSPRHHARRRRREAPRHPARLPARSGQGLRRCTSISCASAPTPSSTSGARALHQSGRRAPASSAAACSTSCTTRSSCRCPADAIPEAHHRRSHRQGHRRLDPHLVDHAAGRRHAVRIARDATSPSPPSPRRRRCKSEEAAAAAAADAAAAPPRRCRCRGRCRRRPRALPRRQGRAAGGRQEVTSLWGGLRAVPALTRSEAMQLIVGLGNPGRQIPPQPPQYRLHGRRRDRPRATAFRPSAKSSRA